MESIPYSVLSRTAVIMRYASSKAPGKFDEFLGGGFNDNKNI